MNSEKNSIFIDYIEYQIRTSKAGGMGQVLILDRVGMKSRVDRIHRPVLAAKLIKASNFSMETCAQFERELNIWISLEHARIVPLLKIVRYNDSFLALMPFFSKNLKEVIKESGVLHKKIVLNAISQVIEALDYAYSFFKIVHLDIKPENVLVQLAFSDKPSYIVSDWGISKIQDLCFNKNRIGDYLNCVAETYNNFGTLPYMAPERLIGGVPSNISSDIYGVGMIMYEMLVGQLPFDYGNPDAILSQILNADYMNNAITGLKRISDNRLASFVLQCIHPDLRVRYDDYITINREIRKMRKPIRSVFRL